MQKHTWAIAAAVAASLALALGQPTLAKGAHAGGGGRLAKMSTNLSLTDAQKAQITPILKSAREQAKAVKADTTLSPEDRKAKMKAIRKNTMAQIRPLLTPDQTQKMAAMRHPGKKADGAALAPGVKAPTAAPAF